MHVLPRSARGRSFACCLLLAAGVVAQAPATAPKPTVVDRALLEALFLGGVPVADVIEVDGVPVPMAELRRGADGADIAPREALEQLLARVLRADLDRRGAWLSDEAYLDAYAAYAKPYDKTPFTVRVVATRFQGFPSLESFQQRWRLVESNARAQPADAFGDAALAACAARARPVLAQVGIDVEWWEHEAPLQPDGRRDFAAATAAAERTLGALRAGSAPAELPDGVRHDRTGAKRGFLNPLQQKLREGEYTTLLRPGVAQTWFASRPGELVGPTRGADAVYVARVHELGDAGKAIDVTDARTRELVVAVRRQELLRERIDAVLARGTVRVPPGRAAAGR